MNFTNSPYEKMMKEIPRPGGHSDKPCGGCRHLKECGARRGRCRKKFRTLMVEAGLPSMDRRSPRP